MKKPNAILIILSTITAILGICFVNQFDSWLLSLKIIPTIASTKDNFEERNGNTVIFNEYTENGYTEGVSNKKPTENKQNTNALKKDENSLKDKINQSQSSPSQLDTKNKKEELIALIKKRFEYYRDTPSLNNLQTSQAINLHKETIATERIKIEKMAQEFPEITKSELYVNFYNVIRNREDEYDRELKYLEKAINLGFISQNIWNPQKTVIQKYQANTCVIDTLGFIMENQYGKTLNKEAIYTALGKQVWDFWKSGSLVYNGKFHGITDNSNDYYKLASLGILTSQISTKKDLSTILDTGRTVIIFEAPLSIFNSSYTGNIYHAVAVFSMKGDVITYADSLSGKIKDMSIKNYTNKDGSLSSEVFFRAVSFNNSKIESLSKFFD